MKDFVAACIQMFVAPNKIDKNIAHAIELIKKAKKEHSPDLIVFQETVTTGFNHNLEFDKLYKIIDTIPGKQTYAIQQAAKKYGVSVVWPTYERSKNSNKIYNSAFLIDRSGEIIGKYRKTHPFGAERKWTTSGTKFEVFKTEFAKIGIIICYDGDFPETVRTLARKGAEVIVRPSAFLRNFEIWSLTNKARAFDNHVFMISANAVGLDAAGNNYFGHSMIVAPNASQLALASASEEIISAKISPQLLMSVNMGSLSKRKYDHLEDLNKEVFNYEI